MLCHKPHTRMIILFLAVVSLGLTSTTFAQPTEPRRPNIIFFLADDLGYNELGCYGQTKIKTPHIDRLAAEGMRFTQHYSGSPVCAPSRCTLLTGLHTGHAYIRDNYEMGGWQRDATEGQLHLPEGTQTLATLLKENGYATAGVGKWGLGGPDTTGHPNNQGFDLWYGYLCQRIAHNYYPEHVWRNNEKVVLAGNPYFSAHQRLKEVPSDPKEFDRFTGEQYAPDLCADEALNFIRENKDQPFFLFYATVVPHAAIQVPDDSLEPYLPLGWDEKPYLGHRGYLPHPAPRAGYAAMVSRMDRDFGRIMSLLDELDLDENTIIFFSSDNGPTFNGGTDSTFFESAKPFRGLKCSVYEGGIRIPMIVRWPKKIQPGSTTDLPSAFWDVMPTLCDLADIETPQGLDGLSMAPTLLNQPEHQRRHDYLYWEYNGKQALQIGPWKAIRFVKKNTIELYNLINDSYETTNIADDHPDLVGVIEGLLRTARTESEHFPLSK